MAFERSVSPPIVVLDANLLYPFQLRNLLVQFANYMGVLQRQGLPTLAQCLRE